MIKPLLVRGISNNYVDHYLGVRLITIMKYQMVLILLSLGILVQCKDDRSNIDVIAEKQSDDVSRNSTGGEVESDGEGLNVNKIRCGSLKVGEFESRVKYKSDISNNESCISEVQISICQPDGRMSNYSGTYVHDSCRPVCDSKNVGDVVSRVMYKEHLTATHCEKEVQQSVCMKDGKWSIYSGEYLFPECKVKCGNLLPGETTSRVRYKDNEVNGACESEVQIALCNSNGILSEFSGTYKYESCSGKCGEIRDGDTTKRVRFKRPYATRTKLCEQEVQFSTCSNGQLGKFSGSFEWEYCSDLPKISVKIPQSGLQKFSDIRDEARKNGGIYISSKEHEVRGTLDFDGESFVISARPKGDWAHPHLSDLNRLSLKVKIKDKGKKLFGMREFAIQVIEARSADEYYFHKHLSKNDIMSAREFFVNYSFNERPVGLMMIEEHFSYEMAENSRLRNSVFITSDENYLWRQRKYDRSHKISNRVIGPYYMPFRIYSSKKVRKSKNINGLYTGIIGAIRGVKEGYIDVEDIIDIDKYANFTAISKVWKADHGLIHHNLKYYVNPFTSKLEPVGFDGNAFTRDGDYGAEFLPNIFPVKGSQTFMNRYRFHLNRIRDELSYIVHQLDLDKNKVLARFLQVTPKNIVPNFSFRKLKARVDKLITNIPILKKPWKGWGAKSSFIAKDILDYLIIFDYDDDGRHFLEISTPTNDQVTVTKISIINTKDSSEIILTDEPIVIDPHRSYRDRYIMQVPALADKDYKYQVTATQSSNKLGKKPKIFESIRYNRPYEKIEYHSPSVEDLKNRFSFIDIVDDDTIVIPEGSWEVDEDFITPNNFNLVIKAGTSLAVSEEVRFIVNGSLDTLGSKEKPVIIHSKMEGAYWGGILVRNRFKKSLIGNTKISDIKFDKHHARGLTGAITFYEGEVEFSGLLVDNISADTAIDFVRTKVFGKSITVRNTDGGGILFEYSNGYISDGVFEWIGKSAFDFVGSTVDLNRVELGNIGQSGIVGRENTYLSVEDFVGHNMSFAVVVNDSSNIVLERVSLNGVSKVAFNAFNIKPEFRKSCNLYIYNLSMSEVNTSSKQDEFCQVVISPK